jgi:hypothetical protein
MACGPRNELLVRESIVRTKGRNNRYHTSTRFRLKQKTSFTPAWILVLVLQTRLEIQVSTKDLSPKMACGPRNEWFVRESIVRTKGRNNRQHTSTRFRLKQKTSFTPLHGASCWFCKHDWRLRFQLKIYLLKWLVVRGMNGW